MQCGMQTKKTILRLSEAQQAHETPPVRSDTASLKSMLYATTSCGMARFREQFEAELVIQADPLYSTVATGTVLSPDEGGWLRLQVCSISS